MKFALVGLLALSGMAFAAPDLNDTFAALKTATEGKDVAQVKTLAPQAAKEAKDILSKPDVPMDIAEFAKGAAEYSEYALSIVAIGSGDPKVTVELTDVLLETNNKSKHVDTVAASYLAALNKESAAKATAGAGKILAGRPENEDALFQQASGGSGAAANKLITVMRTKPKPEGVADADWERKKNAMTGTAYYLLGTQAGQAQRWADADRNLKAALPLIAGNNALLGPTYFFLGIANYQTGKLTQDRSKMQTGINYTQQAAGIAGPMQGQANNNLAAMKKEMAGPATRR
ncbi:MAG: hypothetical protein ABL995_14215 [Bryobacteraceae bacterium]